MQKKITVGLLFGGKSAEHEISLQSAKNVFDAIDRDKYNVVLIGIDKSGNWTLNNSAVTFAPESGGIVSNLQSPEKNVSVDVVFPILHGPFGEDGTVQGLLKLADIPFVGAGVLGSAVGMDKDVMKRLLRDAGVPIGKFRTVRSCEELPSFQNITRELKLPFFVKPANMGSSVGVSKVHNETEYAEAMKTAFDYDTKAVIEEFIKGRELECSVLGNENPEASAPGEIILSHEFYSYEAKYLDEHGAALEIPAKISAATAKEIQALAIKTFRVLECEGLGRVDFFLKETGEIIVNEINTMPGFTRISMYPKMWEASGISYTRLIDKLIELAISRFQKEKRLQCSYNGKRAASLILDNDLYRQ